MSISLRGYDDPIIYAVAFPDGRTISKNYAFFPLYPYLMRLLSYPLKIINLTAKETAILAGLIISLIGTLIALIALADLIKDHFDEDGQLRTAFYLLIFPSSFFLMAVYTEGLFLGLTLSCFALLKRKQWLWAGGIGISGDLDKATGALLVIPIGLAMLKTVGWNNLIKPATWLTRENVMILMAISMPVMAYFIWRYFNGEKFDLIENSFWGHRLFNFNHALDGWYHAFKLVLYNNGSQSQIYYLLEIMSVGLGITASIAMLHRYTGVALFCLASIFITLTASGPLSQLRYALTTPAIFLFLGFMGRHKLFDRAWTMVSLLLLGMLATLFASDIWVA